MYDVTHSDEVATADPPTFPIRPSRNPGEGFKWSLVASCWQVTRSHAMQMDSIRIVSHGRWVWTWELRPVS